jgi:hypothetical protein
LLRLLTPVTKLWTAKKALSLTSESLEAFGGVGYIEDSGLPVLLRDAQVFPIWEGTTNVLSLDVLRVIEKSPEILGTLGQEVLRRAERGASAHPKAFEWIRAELKEWSGWLTWLEKQNPMTWQARARDLSFRVAELMSTALLMELTVLDPEPALRLLLERKTRQALSPLPRFGADEILTPSKPR